MENYKTEGERAGQRVTVTGIIHGNVSNAAAIYGEEKFHAVRGHGFAAERANTLHDRLTGHEVQIVGDNSVRRTSNAHARGHFAKKF